MDTIKNCGGPKWALLIFMYTQYTQGHNIRRIMRPKTLLVWGWFLERKKTMIFLRGGVMTRVAYRKFQSHYFRLLIYQYYYSLLLYRQKQNEQFFFLFPLKSNIVLGHIIWFCLMSIVNLYQTKVLDIKHSYLLEICRLDIKQKR